MPAYNHKNLESNDEHYTQAHVFKTLGLEFDLDVCAPKGGVSYIPALNHYSLEDDGLTQPWFGRVWMNPPYSKPAPWVEKFVNHGNGVALLPVTRGRWFDLLWQNADAIVLDAYNSKFERPDGSNKSITFRTAYFAIGEENAKALHNFNYKVR